MLQHSAFSENLSVLNQVDQDVVDYNEPVEMKCNILKTNYAVLDQGIDYRHNVFEDKKEGFSNRADLIFGVKV